MQKTLSYFLSWAFSEEQILLPEVLMIFYLNLHLANPSKVPDYLASFHVKITSFQLELLLEQLCNMVLIYMGQL